MASQRRRCPSRGRRSATRLNGQRLDLVRVEGPVPQPNLGQVPLEPGSWPSAEDEWDILIAFERPSGAVPRARRDRDTIHEQRDTPAPSDPREMVPARRKRPIEGGHCPCPQRVDMR